MADLYTNPPTGLFTNNFGTLTINGKRVSLSCTMELIEEPREPKEPTSSPKITLESYGKASVLCTRKEYLEIGKEDHERMDKVIKAMSARSKKLMEGVAYKALTGRISPDDCAHSWEHTCISSGHLIECTLCGYEERYDIKGKRML